MKHYRQTALAVNAKPPTPPPAEPTGPPERVGDLVLSVYSDGSVLSSLVVLDDVREALVRAAIPVPLILAMVR